MTAAEQLQRMIYREFLVEPGLYQEAGLDELPARLASLLRCAEGEALARLTASPRLEALPLGELQGLLAIRDMALVSRTAAAVAAELKEPEVSYDRCCRVALCYAVIGSVGHAFSALRAAAGKHDGWARHHFLYGLLLGAENADRARWELGLALAAEPYEEGRAHIQAALAAL